MATAGSPTARFGRAERISLLIAFAWSDALLVAAMLAPVYQSETRSAASVAAATTSATLFQVNGWRALLVAAVPLICTLLVGATLWHRVARPGAGPVAWAVTALLAAFNVLAILSIGVFVLPVTVALAVACGSHSTGPGGPSQVTREPMRAGS